VSLKQKGRLHFGCKRMRRSWALALFSRVVRMFIQPHPRRRAIIPSLPHLLHLKARNATCGLPHFALGKMISEGVLETWRAWHLGSERFVCGTAQPRVYWGVSEQFMYLISFHSLGSILLFRFIDPTARVHAFELTSIILVISALDLTFLTPPVIAQRVPVKGRDEITVAVIGVRGVFRTAWRGRTAGATEKDRKDANASRYRHTSHPGFLRSYPSHDGTRHRIGQGGKELETWRVLRLCGETFEQAGAMG
jgi:hypothetical protein